jgi:hypothetical protein
VIERLTMDWIVEGETERLLAIRRRWDAYLGRYPVPLKRRPDQPDDNVVVNKATVIVDKTVSFLVGEPPTVEVADEAARAYAEAAWQANRYGVFLHQAALMGAITGDVFVRVMARSRLTQPYPRLILLDSESVTPFHEADIEDVYAFRVQWNGVDRASGKPVIRRQRYEREDSGQAWQIVEEVSEVDSRVWMQVAEETWPYPDPPIVHAQKLPLPGSYFGRSDIDDDILSLIRARNFVLTNWNRVLRFHGHPKVWGRGFEVKQPGRLSFDVDEAIVLPDADAELSVLDAGGDSQGAELLDTRLDEAIHEIARVPRITTGKIDDIEQISGVALQILYQPLIEKTMTKRVLYGELIRALTRLLVLVGTGREPGEVTIHWPDPLPVDELHVAQTLTLWRDLGVSQDTLLRRLGLDPEEERTKREMNEADIGREVMRGFFAGGER